MPCEARRAGGLRSTAKATRSARGFTSRASSAFRTDERPRRGASTSPGPPNLGPACSAPRACACLLSVSRGLTLRGTCPSSFCALSVAWEGSELVEVEHCAEGAALERLFDARAPAEVFGK